MTHRCSEIASHHLYGQALTIAAANRSVNVFKALLESNLEISLEDLTTSLRAKEEYVFLFQLFEY